MLKNKFGHHRKILFSLEEKEIRRAQHEKSKEYFSVVWRAYRAVAGLASLLGVLLKECSNFVQKTPPLSIYMQKLETATFAAGCFWGVEETFRNLQGVKETTVGYSDGHTKNPTYEEVCSGETGHVESVEVHYNHSEISYEELLRAFWNSHNPTTYNHQGPDIGSQYRSVIFYHTLEQKTLAEKTKEDLEKSGKWSKPIMTEIVPAAPFYKAEDYHQQYLAKRGLQHCNI